MRSAFLLILLIPVISCGQTIDNLVFEGAGIRGIAYAGVLEQLEKRNLIKPLKNVAGTSAGALVALTISLGYSSDEIRKIIEDTDFNQFNDGKFLFFGGMHRVSKKYGWYRGNKFDGWLDQLIAKKVGNGNITFNELRQHGNPGLFVTATCLNQQKQIVFSYKNYPDMKVKDAIRISMSIPLYFEAVIIDNDGHVVTDPGNRTDLDLVVDGGIIGNFPISIFDSVTVGSDRLQQRFANPNTIGVRIDSGPQIENDQQTHELVKQQIDDFKSYMEALYILVLENLNRNQLTEEDWKRTISVSSLDIGPRIKKLSRLQKEQLVESGRKSAALYFERGK